ncbi:MAG TPA: ATP-binding protein [Bryobacteraceae bacterium]|nr:ATP-binding protein [Bryobacteraceae bacterium]
MKPAWLEQMDELRAGRNRCLVLDGNTSDKVYFSDSQLPPMPLKNFLASYLGREGYAVAQYSLANGLEEMRPPLQEKNPPKGPFGSLPNGLSPEQVLAHATRWLRNPDQNVALILDYADHLAPISNGMNAMFGQVQLAALETLHAWGMDESIRRTQNLVLLVTYEGQVSELLLRGGVGYKLVHVGLPNEEQRREFIEALAGRLSINLNENGRIPAAQLARVTSGLPYVEIEELMHGTAMRGLALDHDHIRERKSAVIDQLCRGLLEVHEPKHGFDKIGGLCHVKDELNRVIRSIRLNPASATAAVLMVGVPGCGKSFVVQALAYELGYPCLAMRNVREGLVGSSERNLERVLSVAETLAPCIIWQDEIDQAFGQRNTGQTMDAGTSERMMARLWEFMGGMKHRGKILWVGTSNRPDILDSALLDRFQLVIPFVHPTPSEVAMLLPHLADQVGRKVAPEVRCRDLAAMPELANPTVRGIQEVVARAGALSDEDGGVAGSEIGQAHFEEAILDYKPNYDPLQHEFIALNAVRMASFKSVLPWLSRKGLRPGAEIPNYLQNLVDSKGTLDDLALSRRLTELAAQLQVQQRMRQF